MIDNFEIKAYNISEQFLINLFRKFPTLYDMYEELGFCKCLKFGLRISINTSRTLTISGKLSSFYFGNNAFTLNYPTLQKALNKLENLIDIPLDVFNLIRLDITSNVVTDNHPIAYFPYLISMPYKERFQKKTTLYFSSNPETIVIYDKKAKEQINAFENYFRFECRLTKKGIKNKLKISTMETLRNRDVYNKIVEYWYGAYNEIEKIYYTENFVELNSVRLLSNTLKYKGLETWGLENVMDIIKTQLYSKRITPNVAYQMKKMIIDIGKSNKSTNVGKEVNSLISELDLLFKNEYKGLMA